METDIELNAAIVRFEGIGGQQLEVGGTDAGVAGFLAGNFGMGQMRIGTTTQRTSVDLIDVVNNGNRGGGEVKCCISTGSEVPRDCGF